MRFFFSWVYLQQIEQIRVMYYVDLVQLFPTDVKCKKSWIYRSQKAQFRVSRLKDSTRELDTEDSLPETLGRSY